MTNSTFEIISRAPSISIHCDAHTAQFSPSRHIFFSSAQLFREKANRVEKSFDIRRFHSAPRRNFTRFIWDIWGRTSTKVERKSLSCLDYFVDFLLTRSVESPHHTKICILSLLATHSAKANNIVESTVFYEKNFNVHDEKAILIAWENRWPMIMRIGRREKEKNKHDR